MVAGQFPDPRSAYIHVPFCSHHCGYCDFTLVAGRDDLIGDYLKALEIELQSLGEPREVDTLFLGGGTPTHLPAPQLAQLFSLLARWFHPAEGCEFSTEANPAGLEDEKVDVLVEAGVNRVSLGIQSFDAGVLKLLERDHRRAGICQAIERLRPRIDNISLDLMFGVPHQSLSLWRETLKQAVELDPRHLSTYGLTFEKGTAFWSRLSQGELPPSDPDRERAMYAAAMDDLCAAGFVQYELSNFARPGFRSRHNEVYWKGTPYFGFGPGAACYVDGRRETNHRSVHTWIERVLAGDSPVGESEELSDEDRAREAIVIGLRKCDGIPKQEFLALTGFDIDRLAGGTIEQHCHSGLLEDTGSHIRLTRQGRFLADSVFVDFL
jgi:oxygen-independent coproporphyrinogen-3 oxidase